MQKMRYTQVHVENKRGTIETPPCSRGPPHPPSAHTATRLRAVSPENHQHIDVAETSAAAHFLEWDWSSAVAPPSFPQIVNSLTAGVAVLFRVRPTISKMIVSPSIKILKAH